MTDNVKPLFGQAPKEGSLETEILAETARVMRQLAEDGSPVCGMVVCVFGGKPEDGTHLVTWVLPNQPVRHAMTYAAACITERALP